MVIASTVPLQSIDRETPETHLQSPFHVVTPNPDPTPFVLTGRSTIRRVRSGTCILEWSGWVGAGIYNEKCAAAESMAERVPFTAECLSSPTPTKRPPKHSGVMSGA